VSRFGSQQPRRFANVFSPIVTMHLVSRSLAAAVFAAALGSSSLIAQGAGASQPPRPMNPVRTFDATGAPDTSLFAPLNLPPGNVYRSGSGAPTEINDGRDNQCGTGIGGGIVDEITGTVRFADPSNHDLMSWPPQAGAMMGRNVIRAPAGGTINVRVSTDARFYYWRIGPRHGRVRTRRLSLGAGAPGRYQLVVSERGHKARALVVVSP